MQKLLGYLALLLFVMACRQSDPVDILPETDPPAEVQNGLDLPAPPNELYGELFEQIQMQRVFPDGKTFVDCIPKVEPDSIMRAYEEVKGEAEFHLRAFTLAHFDLPPEPASGFQSDPDRSISEHIGSLWTVLTRQADEESDNASSLIPLPKDYIVPGGRFREIYYWDSYFTMLGLVEDGRVDMVENMVDNFAYLIKNIGFIPNGNRNYYLTRSQPPFFSMMVALLAEQYEDQRPIWLKYLPAMEAEYKWWMEGEAELSADNPAVLHTVRMVDGSVLNRYYDRGDYPRAESFREDTETIELAVEHGRDAQTVARHLRSGAESGWDYSHRWFGDGENMWTIETTDIIPPDLNALLIEAEFNLATAYDMKGNGEMREYYDKRAENRESALHKFCFNEELGFFEDFHWPDQRFTGRLSLAAAFPLAVLGATEEQAAGVAEVLETRFLADGGLRSSLSITGQQWDAPNGWPPLQYMAVKGLENYDYDELARVVADRWCANNERVYGNVFKMVEKYNVEDLSLTAGGGEYPVQDGFGWSNGVYLALKNSLVETTEDP